MLVQVGILYVTVIPQPKRLRQEVVSLRPAWVTQQGLFLEAKMNPKASFIFPGLALLQGWFQPHGDSFLGLLLFSQTCLPIQSSSSSLPMSSEALFKWSSALRVSSLPLCPTRFSRHLAFDTLCACFFMCVY